MNSVCEAKENGSEDNLKYGDYIVNNNVFVHL